MIDAAVSHVASELNQYLRRRLGESEDRVVISPLFEQNGTVPNRIDNKLVLLLVNIEEVYLPRSVSAVRGVEHRPATRTHLYLDLHILLVANFGDGNYEEALGFISDAASFFQDNFVMTQHNSPDMNDGIERLKFEIENLSIPELSKLWGMHGGRYLPSILYKMRMVTIEADEADDATGEITPVRGPVTTFGRTSR